MPLILPLMPADPKKIKPNNNSAIELKSLDQNPSVALANPIATGVIKNPKIQENSCSIS